MAEEPDVKTEANEKKGGGILPIILAAVVSGAMAVGTIVLIGPRLMGQRAAAELSVKDGEEDQEDPLTYTYPLGEFAANLSEPDRYLRVEVELEIEDPQAPRSAATDGNGSQEKKDRHDDDESESDALPATLPETPGVAELKRKNAQIRDLMVDLFSEQSYTELLDTSERKALRTKLQDKLNLILEDCQVSAVYFTRFIMQ